MHQKPHPAILGTSFAGTVLAAHPSISASFPPGTRVAVNRSDRTLADPSQGAYQQFALADVSTTTLVPDHVPLESAAAVMINLTTMVGAMSVHMGLERPPTPGDTGVVGAARAGKRVLVYGGSSSCGGLGTRYASDAGYEVVTTSSPRNRAFVQGLGARAVVDHSRSEEEVVAELRALGPYDAIVDCVSLPPSFEILRKLLGDEGGVVFGLHPLKGPRFQYEFPECVVYRYYPMAWALEEEENRELAEWYYKEYLPQGLASGRIVPTRHEVVAGGLGMVQETLDRLAAGGSSGHKLVLNPQD